jgi:hypothetical protein
MRLLARLRRPEYTGENRCRPCTIVNAAAVLVAAALVGVVSLPLGVVALVCGLVSIALRGYVIPYTPRFAPRLLTRLPVDSRRLGFAHAPRADGGRESESLAGDDDVDGDVLVRRLAEAGVITGDESGDLFLADGIRKRWQAGMERLRTVSGGELAAATASAAPFPADGRVEGDGDWVVVTRTAEAGDDESLDGEAGDEVWLSRAHAIADTAVVAAVGDRVDAPTAARAATPLRLFLETCPVCSGTVEETTVKACCGGTAGVYDNPETPLLACTDCGEPLYEF